MTGRRGKGKKGQRPEIESQYGYDVKAAMHTIRLLNECKELISSGRITLPRPERALLIRVRTGKFPLPDVLAMAQDLTLQCNLEAANSHLAEKVDQGAVSELIARCYRRAWVSLKNSG